MLGSCDGTVGVISRNFDGAEVLFPSGAIPDPGKSRRSLNLLMAIWKYLILRRTHVEKRPRCQTGGNVIEVEGQGLLAMQIGRQPGKIVRLHPVSRSSATNPA